jgi:hypothetical protein
MKWKNIEAFARADKIYKECETPFRRKFIKERKESEEKISLSTFVNLERGKSQQQQVRYDGLLRM